VEDAGADAPPAARDVRPDARGIIGNEDCGQMSAWYVFSSLGFYPRMSRLERIRADRAPVPESRRAAGQRPYADRYGRQSAPQRLYRFGDARREADRPELHHLRRTDAGRRAALCAPAAPRLRTRDGRCGRAPFADPRRGGSIPIPRRREACSPSRSPSLWRRRPPERKSAIRSTARNPPKRRRSMPLPCRWTVR